jgi:hypothetical protein
MASLFVPSWMESESADGAWSHGVVVFFMCLHVLVKLYATVFSVVDFLASDDGAWTE